MLGRILTLVCVAAWTLTAGAIQWSSGSGGNGHYYLATQDSMTWTSANTLANSLGGYLVDVSSQEENDFLRDTFFPVAQEAFWIGLTDDATAVNTIQGNYVWTSGSAVNYSNWAPGEPNNWLGVEHYAAINWYFMRTAQLPRGTWNDVPNAGSGAEGAEQPYRGIIEFNFNPDEIVADTPAVPEPGTVSLAMAGLGAAWWLRRRSA